MPARKQTRRTVKEYEPPEPTETKVEFTGGLKATVYGCPICGRNGEDKDAIAQHIATHEPPAEGGEEE